MPKRIMVRSPEECSGTHELVCPLCFESQSDSWEIDFGGAEGDTVVSCGSCDQDFFASKHCDITYSSSRIVKGAEKKP